MIFFILRKFSLCRRKTTFFTLRVYSQFCLSTKLNISFNDINVLPIRAFKTSSGFAAEKFGLRLQGSSDTDMKYQIKVGIIGGSGFDDPDIIANRTENNTGTEFGCPSDVLIEGTIKNVPCVFLARHGRKHELMPTNVNYRANIWALKSAGCTHIVASTACGSLREEYQPGDLVFLSSFIDRTQKRNSTFYDNTNSLLAGVCHLPMEPAFCEQTRKILMSCAEKLGFNYHPCGTCVTIEGPRFSSKAESRLYRSWGCDIINMTTVPEVVLAKEAGLCYASVGMVTDYDCWRDFGDHVNVEDILVLFRKNTKKVVDVIVAAVAEIGQRDWDTTLDSLRDVVNTNIM